MNLPSRLPIDSMNNPFTQSINPPAPSSYVPYNYHNNYLQSPINQRKQPNLSSSRQDGPTETLNLNDNPSFARNFKGRLYNVDPEEENSKHRAAQKYKQELRIQMQEDRRRKAAQKAKDEEWDLKLERKFYENIKIEAQQKANKKQEPNYFVMRSAKGKRKHKDDDHKLGQSAVLDSRIDEFAKKDNLKRTFHQPPKIIKRGGYHNQSSLDHTKDYPARANPEQKAQTLADLQSTRSAFPDSNNPPLIVKYSQADILRQEMAEEQDRIAKLLLFQQNMLKKLDYFKKEIYQTDRSLKLEEQYEKVKLKLRAKTINMQKVYSLSAEGVDDILQEGDMYQLPIISKKKKIYEGERQARRKKVTTPYQHAQELIEEPPKKEVIRLRDRRGSHNDKNIPIVHEDSHQMEGQGQIPLNPQGSQNEGIAVQAQF